MCHFISAQSIQSCSHFDALNLLYTSLSCQVSFSPESSKAFGGEVHRPRTQHKQCPKMESGETWYFTGNSAPSGVRNRTTGSDIGKAPHSNHCATSLSNRHKVSNLTLSKWQIHNHKNVLESCILSSELLFVAMVKLDEWRRGGNSYLAFRTNLELRAHLLY